jgi:hypothetical protein
MYAITQICFNIIYMMSTLSQFTHNFNKMHWKVLKQMFHYICETLDVSIEYDLKLMSEWLKLQKYRLWLRWTLIWKSTSEYVFSWLMNQFSEVWNVKTFYSSADWIHNFYRNYKAVWMQRLLKELKFKRFDLMMIYMNNQRIISLTKTQNFMFIQTHQHSSSLYKRSWINKLYMTQLCLYEWHND